MASPASFSTGNFTATTLTITKPSGLVAGEILVAALFSDSTITTPSGWTQEVTTATSGAGYTFYALSRVADSADAAASNFSFSTAGSAGGLLIRVTDGDIYNCVGVSGGAQDDTTGSSISITGLSVTPSFDNGILVAMFVHDGTTAGNTFSNYTSTPSYTWTERFEQTNIAGDRSVGIATAVQTTATTMTAISVDVTNGYVDTYGFIFEIRSRKDGDGTIATNTVEFDTQSSTISGTSIANVGTNTLNLEAPTITIEAVNPTVWTPVVKS